jgi:hypothetical protein
MLSLGFLSSIALISSTSYAIFDGSQVLECLLIPDAALGWIPFFAAIRVEL